MPRDRGRASVDDLDSWLLHVPLRERNALLVAAGYAPRYAETALDGDALAQVRVAIDCILGHQEPYPAFLLNRRWDVLQTNGAAARVAGFLGGGRRHTNMVRRFLDSDDLRGFVVNWEEIAGDLIRHLHEAIAAAPSDAGIRALLEEALAYPVCRRSGERAMSARHRRRY